MTSFDAKRFTSDFVAAMNARDPQSILKYYADSVEVSDPTTPAPLRGKDGVRKNFEMWASGFTDLSVDLREVVQSGNKVALRYQGRARNTGEFLISPDERLPPTNRSIKLEMAEFLTLDDAGKITRDESIYDQVSLMVQLGLMPDPAKPRAASEPRRAAGSTSRP